MSLISLRECLGVPSIGKLFAVAKDLGPEVIAFAHPSVYVVIATDHAELTRRAQRAPPAKDGELVLEHWDADGRRQIRLVVDPTARRDTLYLAPLDACRRVTLWETVSLPTTREVTRWEFDAERATRCDQVVLP